MVVKTTKLLDLETEIVIIKIDLEKIDENLDVFSNSIETLIQRRDDHTSLKEKLKGAKSGIQILERKIESLEFSLRSQNEAIRKRRANLTDTLRKSGSKLSILTATILNRLSSWKRKKRLVHGAIWKRDLQNLRCNSQELSDLLWKILQQITKFRRIDIERNELRNPLPSLQLEIRGLLEKLINQSFVLVDQPQQVVQITEETLSCKVLMLASNFASLSMSPLLVQVEVVRKDNSSSKDSTSMQITGKMLNNERCLTFDEEFQCLSSRFSSILLTEVTRNETLRVEEETFHLNLHMNLVLCDEYRFELSTVSDHIVLIESGDQEIQAWKTVCWRNALEDPNLVPFMGCASLPWWQVANILNEQYLLLTGEHMPKELLQNLARKAFRVPKNALRRLFYKNISRIDYANVCLSWEKFAQIPLKNGETFLDYFYKCTNPASQSQAKTFVWNPLC